MTQVKLMGEMGEKFGAEWECVDTSIRDILKCIDVQTKGFKEYLADCHEKNIMFSIQTGDNLIEEFPELYLNVAKDSVIITPVPAGSGKGLGKLLAGLLLLAAMFFMPGMGGLFTAAAPAAGTVAGTSTVGGAMMAGQVSAYTAMSYGASVSLTLPGMLVASLGVNLAMMGIAEMTAPDPDKMTDDPSYLFNGAENHIEQGQPVPLLYGELTIGGSPIYQGYTPGTVGTQRSGQTTRGRTNYTGTGSYTGGGGAGGGGGGSSHPDSKWVGSGNDRFFVDDIDIFNRPLAPGDITPLDDKFHVK